MKIPRKWEYLANRFATEGFSDCSELATRIDNLLQSIYDRETTQLWDENYVNGIIDKTETIRIINNPNYCVACIEDDFCCEKCKFAQSEGEIKYHAVRLLYSKKV